MTKQELIDRLNNTKYIANMEADNILDWYLKLIYDYCETIEDDSLKELIQQYWCPDDICDYLTSKLTDKYRDPLETLAEVGEFLHYKEYGTRWSYFETDDEINFIDITKDELERLRQRILDFLIKEDKDDKEG